MRFPITDVMRVWNVVYGMPFTSANQWTLMRSFSGLAASSSHFATASVKRFKPPTLDQFCRDTCCFLALGCSAEAAAGAAAGRLAAGAAAGSLGAAFRPAFDDVFEGRPGLIFGLKNCVIGAKPCSVAATWDFGRRLNGGILTRFVRPIAILKNVSIHGSAKKWKSKKSEPKPEKKKTRNNFPALARPVPTPSKQESKRRSKSGSCGISPFLADR